MTTAYDIGRQAALTDLGLAKTASPKPILVRQRKDPFVEIHRKLNRAFKLKMPKFDMTALLKRMFNNPFNQPQKQLSGKAPPIKM